MRHYRPDIMTVLIVLVAIGVIASTTIQAQEISNHRPLHVTAMSTACIDVFSNRGSCTSGGGMMLGVTDNALAETSRLWQPYRLAQDETAPTVSFFALQDRPCKASWQTARSFVNAAFSDPRIGLSRYLTFDFEMKDIRSFEISSIYLGFKDCW